MAKQSKAKQSKAKFIVLGMLALTTLGGTYAWSSISQRVNNISDIPPLEIGARLHDDFNIASGNKDVYVENYSDEPLLVRIKLYEYLEIDGESLIPGADPNDVSTWTPYTMESETALSPDTQKFRQYVTLDFNDRTSKVFLPTFNKDYTSLISDASGDGLDFRTGVQTAPGNGEEDYFQPFTEYASLDGSEKSFSDIVPPTFGDYSQILPLSSLYSSSESYTDRFVSDSKGWFYYGMFLPRHMTTNRLLNSIHYRRERLLNSGEKIKYRIFPVLETASFGEYMKFFDGSSPYGDGDSDAQTRYAGMQKRNSIAMSSDSYTVKPGDTINLRNIGITYNLIYDGSSVTNTVGVYALSGAQSPNTTYTLKNSVITVGEDESADAIFVRLIAPRGSSWSDGGVLKLVVDHSGT